MTQLDPRDIGGLKLWTDAMTYNSLTFSGAEIVRFADKSGYGNHQIGTPGTAPAYSATGLNGLQTVTYASGKFTSAPDHSSLDFTQFTIFVVFQRNTDTAGNQGVVCKQATGGGSNREFSVHVSSTDQNSIQTTTDGTSGTGTTLSIGANTNATPYLLMAYYDGSNLHARQSDKAPVISGSVASVFNGTGTLDYGRAFGASGVCSISEVLFYTNNISTVYKRALQKQLSKKWGLTSLEG